MAKLDSRTKQSFEDYTKQVESQLAERWHGQRPFLEIDGDVGVREKVLSGDFQIHPISDKNPISIHGGLIHDWSGAVFIPNTTVTKVMGILQDFDRHKQIYPEVTDSRLIKRNGNDIEGYWRLQQTNVITVVLDVQQDAHYEPAGSGRWICRAYSRNISEVEDAGTSHEHKYAPDNGHGYLWKLYAYWSLEPVNNGVLAECRTISLSRDIPPFLNWIVKPFINGMPRQSLASTLKDTRAAVQR